MCEICVSHGVFAVAFPRKAQQSNDHSSLGMGSISFLFGWSPISMILREFKKRRRCFGVMLGHYVARSITSNSDAA